ncbi:hypothetical protein PENTCL1PPCAC_24450, partial [Pristionchus entomophagus]
LTNRNRLSNTKAGSHLSTFSVANSGSDMEFCEVSEESKQRYLSRVPKAFVLDDTILPGLLFSSESILSSKETTQLEQDDVVIASYPKSGTTWASEIVSAIAYEADIELLNRTKMEDRVTWLEVDKSRLPAESMFHASKRRSASPPARKRIWFTHLHVDHLPDAVKEGKCKLIYVARNPKDQAVSSFHFHRSARFLGLRTDMTWNEFFSHFRSGFICFGSWFNHVLPYWKFIRNNPKAKLIRYEDMQRNLLAEIKSLEEFIEVPLMIDQRLKIAEHCSFESMKNNKMTNR